MTAPPTAAVPGVRLSAPVVPWLLRAVVVAVFIFPADMVVPAIGASGHIGMLMALVLMGVWVMSSFVGLHDPLVGRNPVRAALGLLWLVTVFTYVTMPVADLGPTSRAAADRWVLALAGFSGLLLTTSDSVRSIKQAFVLIRALTLGATICALVALFQFVTLIDPMDWVRVLMVGMKENGGRTPFQVRAPFSRVAGSTFHPIELGVVACMVLPLAIWRALFDPQGRSKVQWSQCALLGAAAVTTVSRSAILGLAVVAIVLIPFLPAQAKRWSLFVVPSTVVAVFLAVPGFISTVTTLFSGVNSDASLSTRTNNYPRVEGLVRDHPITGQGPGTYIVSNALEIVDNQYLHSAIEMGLAGLVAITLYFALPAVVAVQAARHAPDALLRTLCGAVAASTAVAFVGSATFDSLSFPVFSIIFPVTAGLAGAVWMIVRDQLKGQDTATPNKVACKRSH